jgi:hypothetical protein
VNLIRNNEFQYSVRYTGPKPYRNIEIRNWLRELNLQEYKDYQYDAPSQTINFKDGKLAMQFKLTFG